MDPTNNLKRQRSISDAAGSPAASPGAAAYTAAAAPLDAPPSLASAAPLTPRDPPPEPDSDSSDDGPSKLELLARQLDALRQAGELPEHLHDPPTPPPVLSSFDAAGLAAYVNATDARDIVVMGGAGMSTAAGIPDFRSPGTGLYDNLQKYDLPHPQAIFELAYFRERPEAFYALARELWPGSYCPTTTHLFIKLLHDKGRLLRCFTQNIDSLESAAGVPADLTIAAHGNFDGATCIDTGKSVDPAELKRAIDAGPEGWQGLRDREGGLVKPDIVFFGEGLPRRFFELASQDLPRCKLLLVIGTSLSVQPFAQLASHVPEDSVRCLVNRDPVGRRDPRIPIAVARHLGSGSLDYDNAANYRDVALLGGCDDQIRELAAALGWADDLDRLVAAAVSDFAMSAPPLPPPPTRVWSGSELNSVSLADDDDSAGSAPNSHCEGVLAAEHAPRGPCRVLERRHGLAEIAERGAVVFVERLRVVGRGPPPAAPSVPEAAVAPPAPVAMMPTPAPVADDADDDQSLGGDSTAAYDSGDAAQGSFAAELEAVRCRLSAAGALQILRGRGCTLEDICDVEHSTLVSARLDEMDVHKLWQVVPELRNRRAAREEAEEYDDRSLGGDSTVAYDSGDETAPYLGEGGARKSSRFWGVNWDKSRKKWKASYRDADGTQRCIGYFVDDEEAARAREKVIRALPPDCRKRHTNAVDASGALVPKSGGARDRSAVIAPDPMRASTETTSKFWGVYWDMKARGWRAVYNDENSKQRHIGSFDTQEAAAHAVNAALRRAGLEGRRHTNPVVDGRLVPKPPRKRKRAAAPA